MTSAAEYYECVPDRWGGATLVPRAIPTCDSATVRSRGPGLPLFGPDDSVRSATRRERGLTRDELLTSMNTGKTISLGTTWNGAGVNPKLDAAVDPVRAFVRGFTAGHVVHAEDPGTLFSLGRTYSGKLTDEDLRSEVLRQIDSAEAEWRKDPRSGASDKRAKDNGAAVDVPVGLETSDAAKPSRLITKGLSATEYQAGLAAERAKKRAGVAAATTAPARCSPAEFAEARKNKGGRNAA